MPEINGTKAADRLRGDAQDNILNGYEGNDTLYGYDGNDILIGGTGKDTLDGGAGKDTASYAQATSGIVADLGKAFVTRVAKIMPLGDSITKGKVNNTNLQNYGGYRINLWEKFKARGITIDFVGSQSSGPDNLGDKDHEGHPSWSIDKLDAQINGWLSTYTPDIVLVMAGTNNTTGDSVSQISSKLSHFIDHITEQLPDTQVLVASIPPINPEGQPQSRVQTALDFNAAIPGIVDRKISEGKNVKFVDMRSLTVADISSPPDDNGLHPTIEGYGKIANFWYNSLFSLGVTQGTFSVDKDALKNIENIIGTDFNDKLIGSTGANVIEGGAGKDTLAGDGGIDTFVYQASNQGQDTITDFGSDDFFNISAAGFGGGLVAGVALSLTDATTGVFVGGASPTSIGTSANFLYDTATGLLSFDRDGTGSNSAVKLASLNNSPSVSLEQFKIIA